MLVYLEASYLCCYDSNTYMVGSTMEWPGECIYIFTHTLWRVWLKGKVGAAGKGYETTPTRANQKVWGLNSFQMVDEILQVLALGLTKHGCRVDPGTLILWLMWAIYLIAGSVHADRSHTTAFCSTSTASRSNHMRSCKHQSQFPEEGLVFIWKCWSHVGLRWTRHAN